MKKIFSFMAFGLLAFSQVEGCQKCFNEIASQRKSIDHVIENSIKKCEREGITPDSDWVRGYRAGIKLGLKQGMKAVNGNHPETNCSITQWENILEQRSPDDWVDD